ncbi:MAG: hypothetical protein NTY53_05195 [Kiritimatiellaeota bacterium]|nr:hypothetical protein [Kiritimatiellota bacterium]
MQKTLILTVAFCGVVAFAAGVWFVAVKPFLRGARLYGEAEPLQPMIWKLSYDMREFQKEQHRLPTNLTDMVRFAGPSTNYVILEKYAPRFVVDDSTIFTLVVNEKFGFRIDDKFIPAWIDFDSSSSASLEPRAK